jgi:hypothetical protein
VPRGGGSRKTSQFAKGLKLFRVGGPAEAVMGLEALSQSDQWGFYWQSELQ